MSTIMKEADGKYVVNLDNGTSYTGVPCIGAYDSEREVLRDLYDETSYGGKGIFNEKSYDTGVIFYYTDDPRDKFVFVKADADHGTVIWEEVIEEKKSAEGWLASIGNLSLPTI